MEEEDDRSDREEGEEREEGVVLDMEDKGWEGEGEKGREDGRSNR